MAASPLSGVAVPAWFREPSLGRRLGGSVVDTIVVVPALLLLHLALPSTAGLIAAVSLRALYEIVLVARNGQTVGKAVVGTQVVMFADGSIPSPGAAALRWVAAGGGIVVLAQAVEPLGALVGLASVVVLVPILQGPLHRGLHDQAAGTIVTLRQRRA